MVVDIEGDGPIPGDYSMIRFGAVVVEPVLERTFYAKNGNGVLSRRQIHKKESDWFSSLRDEPFSLVRNLFFAPFLPSIRGFRFTPTTTETAAPRGC